MCSNRLGSENSDHPTIFLNSDHKSISECANDKEICSIREINLPVHGYIRQNEEIKENYNNQVQILEYLKPYIFKQSSNHNVVSTSQNNSNIQKNNFNKSMYLSQCSSKDLLKKSKIIHLYYNPKDVNRNSEKNLLKDQSNDNLNYNSITSTSIESESLYVSKADSVLLYQNTSSYNDIYERPFQQDHCENYCLVDNCEKHERGDQTVLTISYSKKENSDLRKQTLNYKQEQKKYGENILWKRDYEVYYFQKQPNEDDLKDQNSNILCNSSNFSILSKDISIKKSSESGLDIYYNTTRPVTVNCDNSKALSGAQLGYNICPKNISNENSKRVQQKNCKINKTEIDKCPNEKSSCKNLCKKSGDCLKSKNVKAVPEDSLKKKEDIYHIKILRPIKQLSESNLKSKSCESSTVLTGDKKIYSHTQLNVCPCQTSSDTNQKNNCKPINDLSSTSKSERKCDKKENTDWNCRLSVILGCIKGKTRDVDTCTMKSESGSKKSFTNPNIKSRLIDSVPCSKNCNSSDVNKERQLDCTASNNVNSVDSKIITSEISMKGEKIFITRVPCSCSKVPEQKCEKLPPRCESPLPKCPTPPPKCESPLTKCPTPLPKCEGPPPKCSLKDNERIKSIMKSHCEAMTTIKYAMQDMVCKAFVASSEVATAAATTIQSEGAKQLEKIKNYELPHDDVTCPSASSKIPCKRCKPKECNNATNSELPTILAQPINNLEDDEEEEEYVPLPKKIVDKFASKVESAVTLVRENVDLSEFLKPRTFNDTSSKYDVPRTEFLKNNKPDNISNLMDNGMSTSGNAMFKNFTSRLLFMFSDKDKSTSEKSNSSSGTSSDGEDD